MRWIQWMSALGAVGVASVLTLSDSVMGPLGRLALLGLRAVRSAETRSGMDLVSRPDLPLETDTMIHFALWATVGLVAGGLTATLRGRLQLFTVLFGLSALLEVGQRYFSWSRSAELSDLAANGVGLVLGLILATVAGGLLGPGADGLRNRPEPLTGP